MQYKLGNEWNDIHQLRRKGVTTREFWEFLFRSPPHLQAYEQSPEVGLLVVEIWRLLFAPIRRTHLEHWETSVSENSAETPWWHIVKTFPENNYESFLREIEPLYAKAHTEREIVNTLKGLFEALKHPSILIQIQAIRTLRATQLVDPEIFDEVHPFLKAKNTDLRYEALRTLIPFATEYPKLLQDFILRAEDPITMIQEQAILSLGSFPEASEEVLPILYNALTSGNAYPYLQQNAVIALGKLGISNSKILNHLKMILLGEFNLLLRREITYTLGILDEAPNQLLPVFHDLLADTDIEIRRYAIMALRRKGTLAYAALPRLIRAMEDPEDEIRREVAPTLGKIQSNQAVPVLIKALDDSNDIVRRNAVKALGYIGRNASSAIPALFKKISDTDEYFLMNVVESLQILGVESIHIENALESRRQIQETSEALLLLLKSSSLESRIYASWAFGHLKKLTEQAVSGLIEALQDEHKWVRRNTAWSLGNFGATTKSAIPALIQRLHDENIDTVRNVARALGNIGDPSAEVTTVLWDMTYELDKHFCFWRAIALGKLNRYSLRILSTLQDALLDEDYYYVRKNAAEALGALGKVAIRAVPTIKRALNDLSEEVRQQANVALNQIYEQI